MSDCGIQYQSAKTRVCWVVPNLVHYHAARWKAFSAQPGIEAVVIEIGNSDAGLGALACAAEDGIECRTLFPGQAWSDVSPRTRQKAIHRALTETQPEVVCVNGWSAAGAIETLNWVVTSDARAILFTESNHHDIDRAFVGELIKRRVVGLADGALAGGTRSAKYISRLGVPVGRVCIGYDVVDNAHFAEPGTEMPIEMPEGPYFLAVSRFVEKKNHDRLLYSYASYRRKAQDRPWPLVLLGDGERKKNIEELRRDLGLEGYVHMPGTQPYHLLPAWYRSAGALVHVSTTEQWGLVVNEAMAAGLPVIVSDRCGCAADLVAEGDNGFTVDPFDVEAIARALTRIAHGDVDRGRMGARSRAIIAEWGPERFADGLQRAVAAAMAAPPRRASPLDRALLWGLARR